MIGESEPLVTVTCGAYQVWPTIGCSVFTAIVMGSEVGFKALIWRIVIPGSQATNRSETVMR